MAILPALNGTADRNGTHGPEALFVPRNDEQRAAARLIREATIAFLLGGRGTGKTHCAVGVVADLVQARRAARIVLIRPTVTVGKSLGFLPGTLGEKLDPYLDSFKDCLESLVARVDTFFAQYVTAEPLGYLRGRTLKKSVIILDEAQNCSLDELDLVIGRLGEGSRLVVVGDPRQTDTRGKSSLLAVAGALAGVTARDAFRVYSVGCLTLTQQCRHPLLDAADTALSALRARGPQ